MLKPFNVLTLLSAHSFTTQLRINSRFLFYIYPQKGLALIWQRESGIGVYFSDFRVPNMARAKYCCARTPIKELRTSSRALSYQDQCLPLESFPASQPPSRACLLCSAAPTTNCRPIAQPKALLGTPRFAESCFYRQHFDSSDSYRTRKLAPTDSATATATATLFSSFLVLLSPFSLNY